MISPRLAYRLFPLLLMLCLSVSGAVAQDDVKEAPSLRQAGEIYRVRVQNVELGSVEMSVDGGLHYALIGRVQRPALAVLTERGGAPAGIVLRAGPAGIAFTVGAGHVVKLRPQPHAVILRGERAPHPPGPTLPSEIVTNMTEGVGLFGDLLPATGATVHLQTSAQQLTALPANHSLSPDDVFVFIVTRTATGAATDPNALQTEVAALARDYRASAVARARAEQRTVAAGTLTLRAELPTGEPDPIAAVTYNVDDDLIAAQNVGPYSFAWDTRHVPDGEHVVEISALNRNGAVITHVRALIVVNNKPLPNTP
jgi:hypothetical protein